MKFALAILLLSVLTLGQNDKSIAISPVAVYFGKVAIRPRWLTVQNFTVINSTGQPIKITNVKLGDATNSMVTYDDCPHYPLTLGNAYVCVISVAARPQSLGVKPSSLVVSSNAGDVSVRLNVTGVAQ